MASESSATIEKPSSSKRLSQRKHRRAVAGSAAVSWSEQAPARLAAFEHPAQQDDAWQAWQKHLVKRRSPKPIREVLACKSSALLWNAPEEARSEDLQVLLAIGGYKNGKGLQRAVALAEERIATANRPPSTADALCDLALAQLLPKLAGELPRNVWWRLLEVLIDRGGERATLQLDEHVEGEVAWLDQLLAGELPITLAYQFPELRICCDSVDAARDALTEGLAGLTDGEGLVHARHLAWLRPLLACWSRCFAIADAAGLAPWNEEADVQYEWVVRQALRLARSDGSGCFGCGPAYEWQPELFRTALDLAGDAEDIAAAELALPGDIGLSESDELPCEPAVNSEWSQLAVLRTEWKRGAPRLAVDYSGRDVFVELEVGREMLLAGAWPVEASVNGRPLSREDSWEEVCWLSDDDVDYLELSAELVGGGRIDRQILLAREDRFLYLCDNVVNVPAGSLEYVGSLGIAEGIETEPEQETREMLLFGRKPRALVLPLALPEWRIDNRFGELTVDKRALRLRQSGTGCSLASPLFIDLQPHRLRKQRTWRQLTVAESLEICPREAAVGFRAQCGLAQWIFYRSLAPPANRTFFGQNVSTEFFAGRFHRDGEVEELLEIEGEE